MFHSEKKTTFAEIYSSMRRFISLFICVFMMQILVAQTKTTLVKGQITDESDAPIEFAAVVLNKDNNAILAGSVSNEEGLFQLKGEFSGKCKLTIKYIGYNDQEVEVVCGNQKTIDVGKIVMEELAYQIDEVFVTGERAQKTVSVDKTTINPSANISAATGSVLEVLRSAASVSVDNDDNVSIRGNSNILILMDGIPTTVGSLSSIPAANVQNIDIVTSPDVKYDSEGTGGIINIVSKKQIGTGLNGMASFNYGFNGMMNGNLALSYSKAKWSLRFNYSGKYEKDLIHSTLNRDFYQGGNSIHQLIEANRTTSNQVVGANAVYRASKKNIFTLDAKLMLPRLNNVQDFENHYAFSPLLYRTTDISFNRVMFEASLAYKHVFIPEKREMTLLASVSKIKGDRPSFYYENQELVQKSVSGGSPFIAALQGDYMEKIGKGKLETGVKMMVRQNNINHKFYEFDSISRQWIYSQYFSNDLRHREYIPAAYAMYSTKLTEKLSFKAGLRYEYSVTTLHSDKEQLDTLNRNAFLSPNLFFNYQISETQSLSLGFSRRITRPTYPQLNPYINLIDNQTYETGNVNLLPETSNKVDLGYSLVSKYVNVNANAYLNYVQNYISQVALMGDSILMLTYINGDSDTKTGLELLLRIKPTSWLSVDLNNNTYYTKTRGTFANADIDNQGWVNSFNASVNVKPLKGTDLQMQFYYITPQYFPQFQTKPIYYANIGVKQVLVKEKLFVTAMLTDVFGTRRWDIFSDNAIYKLVNNSKGKTRMFWLGITYNFNSFKPGAAKAKKEEEDRSMIRLGE